MKLTSAMRAKAVAALLIAFPVPTAPAAPQPDPAVFDAVLSERAPGGGFDYRGATGQDRKRLAVFLANLGDARPETMSQAEREAFFINAYNAMAIAIVLERYPVKSIRDIGGAFGGIRKRIGGRDMTLDEIENRLREAKDARIHFAIVCASRSCPPLAAKAYRANSLDASLNAQGRAFVGDPSKNVIDRQKGRLALSKIFEWNRKEFERDGGTLPKSVARFVADPALASWLATYEASPEFLDYDWSLNQP